MDKGCANCSHGGTPTYKSPCSECVASGTFSGWDKKDDAPISNRMCVTCKYSEVGKDEEPCKTCIDSGNERSMWEPEPEPKPKSNQIRPEHYTECSLECIVVMLAVFGRKAVTDFCIINAFKYLWRHKYKNGLEDLQKAEQYLAMATNYQMGDKEQENRIINMKAVLEILMRRVSE